VLAGLVPGVLAIASTDSSAAAFSVAAGRRRQRRHPRRAAVRQLGVPQEGSANTRVVTSTYDVSRGQFSGGLVASITRSGSNFIAGSTQYQLRDEDLAIDAGDTRTAGLHPERASGGLGGR